MRHGYRLAGATVAVSLLASFGWYLYAVSATTWQVNDFERLRFPVARTALEAGRHTVWVEGPGLSARRFPANDYRKELELRVQPAADGSAPSDEANGGVDGGAPRGEVSLPRSQVYNTGSIEGRSLWLVDIEAAGTYDLVIDVAYDLEVETPASRNLAVSAGEGLATPIFPYAVWIVIGGLILAAVLVVVTGARDRRDLRRFLDQSSATRSR